MQFSWIIFIWSLTLVEIEIKVESIFIIVVNGKLGFISFKIVVKGDGVIGFGVFKIVVNGEIVGVVVKIVVKIVVGGWKTFKALYWPIIPSQLANILILPIWSKFKEDIEYSLQFSNFSSFIS